MAASRADLALCHELLLPGPAGLWLFDAHDDPVRPSLPPFRRPHRRSDQNRTPTTHQLAVAVAVAPHAPDRKQHCTQLETNSYNTPADFLVMLIVSGAALLVMGAFMGMPFLGMGLVFAIVYVWAKENADEEVNFVFNLAKFKAFYLPWAYVGLAMLMGQSPVAHLMGIAAGHFYVFLDKIVPVQYNRTVLWTPNFLCVRNVTRYSNTYTHTHTHTHTLHIRCCLFSQALAIWHPGARRRARQPPDMVGWLQLGRRWQCTGPWLMWGGRMRSK